MNLLTDWTGSWILPEDAAEYLTGEETQIAVISKCPICGCQEVSRFAHWMIRGIAVYAVFTCERTDLHSRLGGVAYNWIARHPLPITGEGGPER